ncbi:MBL fold metallo-hydrolase [Christensenellaceae bacterium OttesenSCG-928-K19]|nr:MBL fold metallo-hydrolase [Christensenellaceae bacterium OttesenSCG-928-K19]
MKVKVTYLDNSGFAVELPNHFLVFDYMNTRPVAGKRGLEGGVVDAQALKGKNVVVFVSHIHPDHYNRAIFEWRKIADSIKYVLSDDLQPVPNALMVAPGKSYDMDEIHFGALRSTDEGVAFVVNVEGHTIYHAGDLNWWHWEGEDPTWNDEMGEAYKKQINKLRDIRIDIAFVPVDPRLKNDCLRGLDYLMNTARVSHAIPMHYGGQGDYAARAISMSWATRKYRKNVLRPMKRGEMAEFDI